jgi:dephospho-CoA kinase
MHIGLTGAPGSGKTTLAKALQELVPDLFYVYMSRFAVRIPMTLRRTTHPNILEYSRNKYITAVLANQNVQEPPFTRAEMDEYGRLVFERFGPAVIGEIALDAVPSGRVAVFDGIATPENAKYMKRLHTYIVGLTCPFETRVQRRLANPRDIDPKEKSQLERQLRETEEHYYTDESLRIAHVVYDTEKMRAREIAQCIIPRIKD